MSRMIIIESFHFRNKQEKIHEDLGAEMQRISDDKLMDIQQMVDI